MQGSRMPQRISQAVRVVQSSTPEHRLLGPRQCLVLVAKHEEVEGQEAERAYLAVGRNAWKGPVRFGIIDGKHALLTMPGRGKISQKMQGETHDKMTSQHCTRVILFVGET